MSEIEKQKGALAALFADQVKVIGPKTPWALAVSGGSDSLALMYLAFDWAKQTQNTAPIALTVDHGLRDGSAQEALRVKRWASDLALEHHTLPWTAPKPKGDIQAAARAARYRLMGDFCFERNIPSLLLAHTQDDQAETFLLRLARGSGLDGLSGMSPSSWLPIKDDRYQAIRLVRPLLKTGRDQLRSFLRGKGQEWIEDPSNADKSFARVQMRHLLPELSVHGLSSKRLAETAERLQADRHFIEAQAAELSKDCLRVNEAGYVLLDAESLVAASGTLALRVLGNVLMAVGGGQYRPRAASLTRLYQALIENDLGRCRTLAGCQIEKLKAPGQYLISREWRSLNTKLARQGGAVRIRPGQHVRWDHRIDLALRSANAKHDAAVFEAEVRPLGPRGWQTLKELCQDQGWLLPQIPERVRATLPGLWVGDELVSAMSLDKVRPDLTSPDSTPELRFEGRFVPYIQGIRASV